MGPPPVATSSPRILPLASFWFRPGRLRSIWPPSRERSLFSPSRLTWPSSKPRSPKRRKCWPFKPRFRVPAARYYSLARFARLRDLSRRFRREKLIEIVQDGLRTTEIAPGVGVENHFPAF